MNFSAIPRNSLLGKLLRYPLNLLPAGMTVPIMQGPMRGMRWVVGAGDHGYWLGSYELRNQLLLADILNAGDVVMDVGAHVGYFTLLASRLVGDAGHVYAFEPLPRNAKFIERHVRINQLENVTLIQAAISDRVGSAFFGDGISSSTGRLSRIGDLEVKTLTLDELISSAAVGVPRLIKIDVEGAESEVLDGAISTLQQEHPNILLATHGPEQHMNCVDLLQSLDYELKPINAGNILSASEFFAFRD